MILCAIDYCYDSVGSVLTAYACVAMRQTHVRNRRPQANWCIPKTLLPQLDEVARWLGEPRGRAMYLIARAGIETLRRVKLKADEDDVPGIVAAELAAKERP